jgi:hypothetical protein
MMTVGVVRFADGGARCDEREVVCKSYMALSDRGDRLVSAMDTICRE